MEESSTSSEDYEIIDTEAILATSVSKSDSQVESLPSQEHCVNMEQIEKSMLKIANNGNQEDLNKELSEVIKERESSTSPNSDSEKDLPDSNNENSSLETVVKTENYEKSILENEETDNYTIFNQILYLGAASINAPRSEPEVLRNMSILNSQVQAQLIEVSVSIPSNSNGSVRVYDASNQSEIVNFKVHRISYIARGKAGTNDSSCFAFTSSHGDSKDSVIWQCHVFRCQIPEAIDRVLSTFVATFNRHSGDACSFGKMDQQTSQLEHHFDISLEIREDDGKGHFSNVPRDKEVFKLRSNVEKQLTFSVTRAPNSGDAADALVIDRCFGVLVARGREVKHADMHLLVMEKKGSPNVDRTSFVTTGFWDPRDPALASLNIETPKDIKVSMTVAIDLVIRGIQEPVRFLIETKIRVFPQAERFWYYSKKSLTHSFALRLKQVETSPQGDHQFVVVSVDNLGEVERMRPSPMSLSLNLTSLTSSTLSSLSGRSPSVASVETPMAEEDSDDDEPLLSGSGEVSKECSEAVLEQWKEALPKWQSCPDKPMTKDIGKLVKKGVPEALRGEVWQLLAGCVNNTEMMETYRGLLTKECVCEQVILRDINRTFPAHEFFKDTGGGQESLFRISRAYSVYDEEVSYCQGTSFLAAALLLHMPEEQSFCVLVKIMFEYGLRDLFKDCFEVLHMRFYQLDRLMEEQLPDLYHHFEAQGVESHMFASQWFLTLYTAKFPLFMVFHYLDIFLLLGIDSVFQVAIALLQMSRKELLSMDFEGILKHFRVSLPKKYRSEEQARQMIRLATGIKVKKIKRYEHEYLTMKEQEALKEDPVVRLERENKKITEDKMRLERENDDLAAELVNSKIDMMKKIDKLEDDYDKMLKDKQSVEVNLRETEEEKFRLQQETFQVKEMLKKEVAKGDRESKSNSAIIADYKKICSQLSEKLDREQSSHQMIITEYKMKIANCKNCSQLISPADSSDINALKDVTVQDTMQSQIKELEIELAKTKLALVESECKNQDLTHQLNSVHNEIMSSKNTWFQKTLTSISSLKERSGSTSGTMRQLSQSTSPPLSPKMSYESASEFDSPDSHSIISHH